MVWAKGCSWLQILEQAAKAQPLCRYLGLQTASGDFEPDPHNWALPDGVMNKENAMVWYEWLHVIRAGTHPKPHRVCIEARHIVHDSRSVPHNPLSRSCPHGLTFDLRYMEEFVAWKCLGGEYVGITFESDHVEFSKTVPDGGRNIQDHPVYWNFPGGVECLSLRELLNETKNLQQPGTREAYEDVAEQMAWDFLGVCEDDNDLAQYDEGVSRKPIP